MARFRRCQKRTLPCLQRRRTLEDLEFWTLSDSTGASPTMAMAKMEEPAQTLSQHGHCHCHPRRWSYSEPAPASHLATAPGQASGMTDDLTARLPNTAPTLLIFEWRKNRSVAQALRNGARMRGLHRISSITELKQFVQLWTRVSRAHLSDQPDDIRWRLVESGQYSASSAYITKFHGSFAAAMEDKGREQVQAIWLAYSTEPTMDDGSHR
jgi:hypothetical protein